MTDAFDVLAQIRRVKPGQPEVLEVPTAGFLMIDGEGDPASDPAYTEAVEGLFAPATPYAELLRPASSPLASG